MQIQPWNIVFLVGFIAYVVIRGVYEERAKGNERVVSRAEKGDSTLIFILAVGSLLLPVVYLLTHWLAFADYHLPTLAPWFGTVVIVAALWLFWRSHADLGRFIFQAVAKDLFELPRLRKTIAIVLNRQSATTRMPSSAPRSAVPTLGASAMKRGAAVKSCAEAAYGGLR
jgi:hypothetical protein